MDDEVAAPPLPDALGAAALVPPRWPSLSHAGLLVPAAPAALDGAEPLPPVKEPSRRSGGCGAADVSAAPTAPARPPAAVRPSGAPDAERGALALSRLTLTSRGLWLTSAAAALLLLLLPPTAAAVRSVPPAGTAPAAPGAATTRATDADGWRAIPASAGGGIAAAEGFSAAAEGGGGGGARTMPSASASSLARCTIRPWYPSASAYTSFLSPDFSRSSTFAALSSSSLAVR